MKTRTFIKGATVGFTVFLMSLGLATTQALGQVLFWQEMRGVVVPGTFTGTSNVVGGINSVPLSWSAIRGNARVNLQNGQVAFYAQGLVLAAQGQLDPSLGLVIAYPVPRLQW